MIHVDPESGFRRTTPASASFVPALLLFAALAPLARSAQAPVEERIRRIENGLLPPVHLKGGPITTMRLADRLARLKIPGVSVAVINDGKVEWARAYGVREAGTNAAVTPDTLFQAASISKPVAALAALHFVERGVLSLDGDINDKLTSWKIPANAFTAQKAVTVRELLSHSAGLTVHGFPGYAPGAEIPSLVAVLDGAKPANTAPVRVDALPGSVWSYSGGGYTVLQQLLIDVLHEPFPRLMAETVLGPAGMRHSTYEQPLPKDRLPFAAVAHLANGKPVEGGRHIYPEMAAAGLWTTPTDLCRFAIEVMNAWKGRARRVIGRDTAREMLTIQKAPSGLGLMLSGSGTGLRFEHGGSNAGFTCMLVAYPGTGKGAAVMVNSDAGGKLYGEILRAVAAAYEWPDFKPKEKTLLELEPALLDRYAGEYEVQPGFSIIVSRQGDGLAARVPGNDVPIELLPETETHFFALDQDLELSFIRKEDGTVTGFAAGPGLKARKVDDAARVTRLADEYVKEYIARNPEAATFEGLPDAPDDKLSDNSLESLKAWQAKEDGWLARLAAIDGAALWGRPEWLTFGFLREALEGSKGLRIARLELWPVNQMSGWQATLTQLASIQPVGTAAARERALARFRQVPRYLETEVLNLKEGLRLGYSTPKPNVELTLAQLDALLQAPVKESPFFFPATKDGDAGFQAEWERLLTEEITPAVRRYRDFLEDEYLPKARTTIAISALPNGAEAYRALLRAFTTLDRTAEETSLLGEQAVARYEAQAADIGRKLFGAKDLKAVLKKLERDPRNRFKTREELMEFSKAAVDRARRAMPQWVEFMPKAEVVIEAIPAYLEKTASSAYQSGAIDGSRPGVYLINLYQPENQTRANAELTAFHETYPGHHFQISVSAELPRPHLITRLVASGGYIEGWARYSEALAEEMGLYSSDPSRINRRLWPAHGMVVDPGLHVLGWTREQAVAYIRGTGRFSPHEAESMVDRIIAWPAQLTTYDTGGLEFFALRERAGKALGPKFDIRAFHSEILRYGAVTLPMLREIVDRWIADRK